MGQLTKNHPQRCDNCKRLLGQLLDQAARTEFCSEYCTAEWAAKKAERPLADDEYCLQDEALKYVQAVLVQQDVEAAFVGLLFAAARVEPKLRPQRFDRRGVVPKIVVTLSPLAVAGLAALEGGESKPVAVVGQLFADDKPSVEVHGLAGGEKFDKP